MHIVLYHLYKILENLIYNDEKGVINCLRIQRGAKGDYKGAQGNFWVHCTLLKVCSYLLINLDKSVKKKRKKEIKKKKTLLFTILKIPIMWTNRVIEEDLPLLNENL